MKNNSIKVYITESNMNFYSWALIADGFLMSPSVRNYIGSELKLAVLIAQNDTGRWGVDPSNWNDLGLRVNGLLKKKKLNYEKLLNEHFEIGKRLFKLSDSFFKKDIKKQTYQDFAKWFSEMWPDYLELNGLGFMAVVSDFEHNYLSKHLIDILQKHLRDPIYIQAHLSKLISSNQPDLNWQELLDFLALIKKYKTYKRLKEAPELEQHIEKYSWINFGYIGPTWNKKDFLDRAKKILLRKESVSKQYFLHNNHFQELRKQQQKLTKELRLSKDEQRMFAAAKAFMFLKAYRLNVRHRVQYISELIFSELSQRTKLSINSFRYSTRDEIIDFLSGQNLDMIKIADRRKGMVEITEKRKKKILKLTESKKLLDKVLIKEELKQGNQVVGQAAYLGHVKGRVKILYRTEDMTKVKKGDILFAITTTPDLLPAMNKAAAFVTDQGGITSHAAIVAREMKKPCVIGTKFGTKIFKDGDMVEVDANKGIVRKISN